MNRRDLLKAVPALAAASQLPLPARAAAAKGRLRSAICCYSYRLELAKGKLTYEDVIRLAVENDVDGLDMTVYWFPKEVTDDFLFKVKRLAYKNAVEIYSIAVRTEMTQRTPELQQKELAGLRQWVDIAEKLGAGHIRVFGGKIPKDATEDQATGWVIEVLKRGAEYAGKKGIILGLENHGGVTEKAETIVKIIKAVDSPWVGVNLDTGNFIHSPYESMALCMPYAASVQVKVNIREQGKERVPSDWDRIGGMLVKSGYRGYLALEYEEKEDTSTAMPRLLKKLNEVVHKYSA